MKKKIFIFNFYIILSSLLIICLIIISVNYFVYNNFEKSKDKIISYLYKTTGFHLKYNKLSPNIIGSFKLYDVTLYNDASTYFYLGNINVSYKIFNLFNIKKNPFSIISKISIEELDISSTKNNIDMLIDNYKKNNKKSFQENSFNISNLKIEIKDFKINLNDKNNFINLFMHNLKLNIGKEIKIETEITSNVDYEKNKISFTGNINGDIGYQHELTTSIFFDVNILTYNGVSIKRQRINFKSENTNFTINRIKDMLPIELSIVKKENELILSSKMKDFLISDVFVYKDYKLYFPDKLTMDSKIIYDLHEKKINGSIFVDSFFQKLFSMENLTAVFNVKIINNIIYFNDSNISNYESNGNITINGNFPIDLKTDFLLNCNLNNFKFKNYELNTKAKLSKTNNSILLNVDNIIINNINFGNFSVIANQIQNKYIIETIDALTGYSVKGNADFSGNTPKISLKHKFTGFYADKIIKIFKPEFNNQITFYGDLTTDYINNKLTINDSNFEVNLDNENLMSFGINYSNDYLKLFNINIKKYGVKSDIGIDFNKYPYILTSYIKKDNFEYNLKSQISKSQITLNINDSLYSDINFESKIINVSAKNFIVPINNNNVNFNFNVFYNLNENELIETQVNAGNLSLFSGKSGIVTANVSYKNDNLKLDKIIYTDNENIITGNINNEINLSDKIRVNGNGFLKDDKNGESYSLNYKIVDTSVDSKIQVTHFNLNKIFKSELKGFANIRFNITGELINPKIELDGELSDGKLGNSEIYASFQIKKNNNNLLIKKVFFQLAQNSYIIKDSNYDLISGKIDLKSSLNLDSMSKNFKMDINITGVIPADIKSYNLDIGLDKMSLGYYRNQVRDTFEKYDFVKLNISKNNDGRIYLTNYGDKFINLELDKDVFLLSLFNKGKLILDTDFKFDNNNLNGKISFIKFPLNTINKFLEPYIGLEDGFIDGDLNIKGTTKIPEYYGRLNIYGGIVNLPNYLSDKIVNISGLIIADKDKFLINNVNGIVNKGNTHGYGEIVFNGLKFEHYLFKVTGENIPGKYSAGIVEASGKGNIKDLTMEGKDGVYNFIGDLEVASGDVNIKTISGENGTKKKKPRILPINALFSFKAGSKVTVNYPIIKGTIKQGDIFTLKYIGSEPNVYFGGDINLIKGEINYFTKNFKIEEANFKFEDEYPVVNPTVKIKSTLRTRDSKGEQIKITLYFKDRLLSFKTDFTSNPYRTGVEIGNILGLNIGENQDDNDITLVNKTGNTESINQSIDSFVNTTNYFSNAVIFNPIESNIRKFTGLDTFSMKSNLFGNIMKSGTNLYDVMDDSSITIGKYLSNELYIGSMMTFNKKSIINDKFFLPLQDKNYGLNLQLMLLIELPYFNIGYSFIPVDMTDITKSNHKLSFEANFKF